MSDKKGTTFYLVGTASAALDLTDAYQEGTIQCVDNAKTVCMEIDYTMGSGESDNVLNGYVEWSNNETDDRPGDDDFYQELTAEVTAGLLSLDKAFFQFTGLVAETADKLHFSLPAVGRWMRLFVKETGVDSNYGTLTIKAMLISDID